MFSRMSDTALIGGIIASLLFTGIGVIGLAFVTSLVGSDGETAQVLRGAAAFLTGLSMFYAGGLLWIWLRRRRSEVVLDI